MKRIYLLFVLIIACSVPDNNNNEQALWEEQAAQITIIRDSYGVPHIYGKTDADAVFGMLYAQCEDDFNRIEMNYINAMGRLAEVEGLKEIYRDLRMKLFINPYDLKQQYKDSPEWLKELMNAFADGINYFLYKHPEVQPKLINHFEPWMALSFSEGSIGGDIERVSLKRLEAFYGKEQPDNQLVSNSLIDYQIMDDEPRGSNGIAIAPSLTKNGHSLFLINPHTSFFFRSEVHMMSEEGLNAYGAVTWGQFFIYQGFNEKTGWMHTSSRADAIDEYLETITDNKDGTFSYLYGDEIKAVEQKEIMVPYKTATGMAEKRITAYYTVHGPVIRSEDGDWVTIKLMQRPVDALRQSYMRTKSTGFDSFYESMKIKTNSSNNTVYADADGNIAYYHGNFIPRRDTAFIWDRPVDGSNPATEWDGLHTLDEMIIIKNPTNGWIQNCNSTPFTAAGTDSPKQENFPQYMAPDNENFRGQHAIRVLQGQKDFTIDKVITAAFDPYLTGFAYYLPMLMKAYDSNGAKYPGLKVPIATLREWDFHFGEASVPTSLAVYWGQELMSKSRSVKERGGMTIYEYMAKGTSAKDKLDALQNAINTLNEDFGTWKTPWGKINRYQRINGEIAQPFNDDEPSLPVGFVSGRWGSLASFGARTYPGTKKMYGTSGNSFIAVVEFGDSLVAKTLVSGGQSGDPDSPHFDDQAIMYTKGEFKDVRFYKKDIEANAEKTYHPGELK